MSITEQRRARLAARVSTLSLEQVRALKASVEQHSGHAYNDVQTHAWGMCPCGPVPCPPWVELGFVAAEQLVDQYKPSADKAAKREQIAEVLDMTALEMTGLLRGVVLDQDEIKSSKQAEDGDVFASPPAKKR
jgi:hypothetical protein